MSILIKGMEKPDCCDHCPLFDDEYQHPYWCMALNKQIDVKINEKYADCPITEIPPLRESDGQYYRDIAKAYNVMFYGVPRHQTNSDKIRGMTDEELAEWLNDMQGYSFSCGLIEARISEYPNRYNAWLEWLKEEAKE